MSKLVVDVDPGDWGFSADRLARIAPHFDKYVEDRRLAGWLATISRGGQLLWTAKGGHRDRERNLAVEDDTIWRIYSMTKPITAVAVMMLYEEGLFDLNDDVGQWIDALARTARLVRWQRREPETVPATEADSRASLAHPHERSDLRLSVQAIPSTRSIATKGYDFIFKPGADLVEAVDDWGSSPLSFNPERSWNYSVAFDVLGRLIEIWSGQPLDVFMKERIFDPLGMGDTEWWCPPEKADRLAMLYVPSQRTARSLRRLGQGGAARPRILGGGGGLLSTAYDYDRFANMLLRGGELDGVRLLSSRTVELMTSNHLPGDVDMDEFAIDSFSRVRLRGAGLRLWYVGGERSPQE